MHKPRALTPEEKAALAFAQKCRELRQHHGNNPRFTFNHVHAAGVRIGTVDPACLPTKREADDAGRLDPFKCQQAHPVKVRNRKGKVETKMVLDVIRLAEKAQRLNDERDGRKPRFIPRRIREGGEPAPVIEDIPRIPLPDPHVPTKAASYTRLDRNAMPRLHGPRERGYVAKGGYTGLKQK